MADGTGGHAFAESLDAHQRNVARWRAVEKSRQSPPDAVDKADPPATSDTSGAAATAGTNAALLDPASPEARSRAFDASEGTRLDPLKNKTYDLGSPKSIPVLADPPGLKQKPKR